MTVPAPKTEPQALVEVRHLVKHFPVENSDNVLQAVDDVSFDLFRGETLGLVGESGCGKSTVGRCLIRLHEPTSGEIIFEGTSIVNLPLAEMQKLRRKMQIVFQDPYASLNPRWTVARLIAEPLEVLGLSTHPDETAERVAQALRRVRMTPDDARKYPHQFSGGQRQRISIARALATCLLYTSPSPRDGLLSRMPSSA